MGGRASKPEAPQAPSYNESRRGSKLHYFMGDSYEPPSKSARKNTRKCRYPGCEFSAKTAGHTRKHERIHEGSLLKQKGVRSAGPVTVSQMNIPAALAFVEEVNDLPVYLISAHSCICMEGHSEECFGKSVPFSFKLPENTYVLSFAQPGDKVVCAGTDTLIRSAVDDIRQYLYLHGTDDILRGKAVGVSRFHMFAGVQRAVGPSEYLNIYYTFNEYDGEELVAREKNPYGVYNISKKRAGKFSKTNTDSIIAQDPARVSWSLQDIIKEVYRKEGVKRAIFLNTGCLLGCFSDDRLGSLDKAAGILYTANEEYKGLRETFTADELGDIARPTNRGVNVPFVHQAIESHLNDVASGIISPKTYRRYPLSLHPDDVSQLQAKDALEERQKARAERAKDWF
jgi:hypothetical protein